MKTDIQKIKPQRLKQLLRKLIDIYSPSGKEEKILDFLYSYLRRSGLPVIRQEVDDYRYNILVFPENADVELVLLGHIDTVWAYELDDYGFEEEGDILMGLGAADMKGNCAAMIEAYMSMYEKNKNLPFGLALVVGEEEEGDGSAALAQEYHFPWAIIGEPTDLKPCLSHYGYLEVQLCTKGKRMHASLADMAQNAIDSMLRLLLKISHHIGTKRPEIIFNIREMESSRTGFVVPDRCEAWLDLHLPPTSPIGEITFELDEIVSASENENPPIEGTIRYTNIHSGYDFPEKGSVVEALKNVYNKLSIPWEPQAFRSHSDANLLWASGIKTIILGAGQLELAHRPDESISFKEVKLMSEVYYEMLASLLE